METTKYPEDKSVLECLPQYGKIYLSCKVVSFLEELKSNLGEYIDAGFYI